MKLFRYKVFKYLLLALVLSIFVIGCAGGGSEGYNDTVLSENIAVSSLDEAAENTDTGGTLEANDAESKPIVTPDATQTETASPPQDNNKNQNKLPVTVLTPDNPESECNTEMSPDTGPDANVMPENAAASVEPDDITVSDKAMTVTLSVTCNAIFDNIDKLNKEKVELVPPDGVIFPVTEIEFYEGESVFNVLQREMKKNKIHMEFVNTPLLNSAFIEGLNNLYEFDCGELSGWMYKVNDWFPNYGCSRYLLQEGDMIEWVYTCDLGRDVGDGHYLAGVGQ